jgi:hypothetical protein
LRFVDACRDWPRRATPFSCVDKKRKQKKRPQDAALRVPEKMRCKAGNERTRLRLRQLSFLVRFAPHFFGSVFKGIHVNSEPPENSVRNQPKQRNNVAQNVEVPPIICFGVGFGFCFCSSLLQLPLAVPLLTLPKERAAKRIKKRNLSEPQASLFRFPLCRLLFWEPEGQRLAVAFLCLLSLAKQRK